MGDRHNGFLVSAPDHEAPAFLSKDRQRENRPICSLTQQIPNDRIALAYEAGSCWLLERAESLGCRFDEARLRVDSHTMHCLKGHRDANGTCSGIALGTLDFEGVLEVADPVRFLSALYNGIGPAKSFGCGLLLVRRAG